MSSSVKQLLCTQHPILWAHYGRNVSTGSRRLLTAVARVQTQGSPCEICAGWSGRSRFSCPVFGFSRDSHHSILTPHSSVIALIIRDWYKGFTSGRSTEGLSPTETQALIRPINQGRQKLIRTSFKISGFEARNVKSHRV
jgi:hypothetical protein